MYKPSRYNVIFEDDGFTIFVNFLTQAISRVKGEKARIALKILKDPNASVPPEWENIKRDLIYGGYIVDEKFDELNHLKFLNRSARFDKSSLTVTVIPTFSCNFDCIYCYETKNRSFMSEETAKKLIKLLENAAKNRRTISLGWFGGEPLLGFEIIKLVNESVKKACDEHKTNFYSSMSTNGYLLTREKAELFDELGIKNIQITLDGPEKTHDLYRKLQGGGKTFNVIIKNLNEFFKVTKETIVTIRVNVGPDNFQHIEELFEILEYFPKDRIRIYFRWIFSGGKNREFIEKAYNFRSKKSLKILSFYEEAMKRGFKVFIPILSQPRYCEYDAVSSIVVGPSGEIYPCTVRVGKGYEIGKLLENGIEYNRNHFLKWHSFDAFEDPICLNCKLLPLCMGGCRNARYDGARGCPEEARNPVEFAKHWYKVKLLEKEAMKKHETFKI